VPGTIVSLFGKFGAGRRVCGIIKMRLSVIGVGVGVG